MTTTQPATAEVGAEPNRRQLFAEIAEHGISGFIGEDRDLDRDERIDLAIDALAYVVQELCARIEAS